VRIAVLHPQTAFVRGGAETHAEALVKALRAANHDADLVQIAGKWYPPSQLAHQMAVWRSFDITESNGLKVDAVIALKFPAYLAQHERKIVWLIHQHRTAYELWDHPDYADLKRQDDGAKVRDMVWEADRVALGEAKRVFTNAKNVRDRLWSSLRVPAESLYHPSHVVEDLLDAPAAPAPLGEYLLFPSRMESLKRQSLAIDAMQRVSTGVRLVLVGRGPDEPRLRDQVQRLGLGDRVSFEIGVSDARLLQLYRESLGVYFGPFDEDYGYVTIEGFAASRPVITLTDAGGPLEFVRDDETGLVRPPEPAAIAEAFDRLWNDREGARRMGSAGHALVRAEVPRWPDIVARLLD
jgi:glycosyltransferase involved in cell wall biosynthesis